MYSYQHVVNAIKLIYESRGFVRPNKALGEAVYDEFNIDIKESEIGGLFAFVDEFIILLRYISYFFTTAIDPENQDALTFYRLSIRQIKTLSSIRLLCSYGLDVNARMQLRLLYETSLVWTRSLLDEDFKLKYQKCKSEGDGNRFWHENLSKGKTEKVINNLLESNKMIWLGDINLEHLNSILSETMHPTHLVDQIAAAEDLKNDNFATSSISNGSHFTLSNALLCAATPFTLSPHPRYNIKLIDLRKKLSFPPTTKDIDVNDYFLKLNEMMSILLLYSFKCMNGLNGANK